jgi:hypothetical protein
LDFDKRGVLQLLDAVDKGKTKSYLYVRIWTMAEFDAKYMRGCLMNKAHGRIDREPYIFEDGPEDFSVVRKSLDAKKRA